LLTGAWVVGTLEGAHLEAPRVRSAVIAFYKGIFLIAFPLALAGGALLGPIIRLYTGGKYPPSERIAPVMLGFFVAALLATPWGLVVRIRELAWLNALITIAQVGFAALADLWLIQSFGLWGAVAAVGLTAALTILLTFIAWRAFDRATLSIPWEYAGRCLLAASPYLLLLPFAFVRLPTGVLVVAALGLTALTTVGWAYLVRRFGLLSTSEVPLLHKSRHAPVRLALRYLAPTGR
jgi:O-antigen/teichoic acid export membrane protein